MFKEIFWSVRLKNIQAVIFELKDRHDRIFTKREDLEGICQFFYQDLYAHKEVTEDAIAKTLKGFPAIFSPAMNEALSKEITKKELWHAVTSMVRGKVSGHDDIPVEFLQKLWHSIGKDFHLMILNGIKDEKIT